MQKVQKGTHPGPSFDFACATLRMPGRAERRPKAGVEASPPGRGAALAAGWVVRFVRCRRAAATAIGAAIVTLMSLGGFALTSDHTHLVYQRDVLKAATDAASLAASRHWRQTLGHLTDDDDIKDALKPIAMRYIRANIPENRRDTALQVTLTLHHGVGMVDVSATADLGGIIFANWMLGDDAAGASKLTRVETRTERLEAGSSIIEVALAIDSTTSMDRTISGSSTSGDEDSRLTIVKRAAVDLVDILASVDGDSVAIGVVPWGYQIRLDTNMQTRWEDNSWAHYPTQRYYERPYKTSTQGESQTLPATRPEAWKGCLDQRTISGDNPPGLSAAPPTPETPFYMAFYTPMISNYNVLSDGKRLPIAYTCHGDDMFNPQQEICYSDAAHFNYQSPQFECHTSSAHWNYVPTITPLTTDMAAVKSKIQGLQATGRATNSTLGVAWGHRLLAHSWKTVWGDATHPVNPVTHPQALKALVLLTDGADNYPDVSGNVGREVVNGRRDQACTAVKNAGIKVFTIAAMDKGRVGTLADPLKKCSSQADDPNGNYVFINNAKSEDLEDAFREIARQLVRFRRVY